MQKNNSFNPVNYIILLSGLYEFLRQTLALNVISTEKVIITSLLLVSGALLIVVYVKSKAQLNYNVSRYVRVVYLILLVWCLGVIARSLSFNLHDLISLVGNNRVGWVWLTPLALVFGVNMKNWIKLLPFLIKSIIFSIVLFTICEITLSGRYSGSLHVGANILFSFFPMLLLTLPLYTTKAKVIVIAGICFYLLMCYFTSLRIGAVNVAILMVFMTLITLMSSYTSRMKKILLTFGVFIFTLMLVVVSNYMIDKVRSDEVLMSDTRTFLFMELFEDLSVGETIVGRGALGTYYSAFFSHWNDMDYADGDSEQRLTSEVGYLKMILKGGYVLVALNLMLLLPAAYLGIFRSKNMIARASGFYILSLVLLWAVAFPPAYLPNVLILWMAAGTCLSAKCRNLSDLDILKLSTSLRGGASYFRYNMIPNNNNHMNMYCR